MGAQYSHLIFQPPTPPTYDETLSGLVWIKQEGFKIAALNLELESKDKPKYTVLYIPGNTEDLGRTKSWLHTLQLTLKVNILTFDYPGYGLSEGEVSEKNIYASSLIVYKYLLSKNLEPNNVLIMGKDLGTSGALHIFQELNHKKRTPIAAGLILMTSFTSLMAISNTSSKLKFGKFGDMFENIKKVDRVFCPTLIAHGQKDDIVDIKLAKKLASKISTLWRFLELENVGHFGIEVDSDFLDTCIEFLDEIRKLEDPSYQRVIVAHEVPAMYRLSPINSWLQEIHMEQYTELFLSSGYFNLEHISTLDRVDLFGIGIENEDHINIILDAIPGKNGERIDAKLSINIPAPEKNYAEVEVIGPCDEDSIGFCKILEHHGARNFANFDEIPPSWKKAISFASTVNIPHFRCESEQLIVKDYFGEIYETKWNSNLVIKHKLNHKRSQFKSYCKDTLILCQLKHPNVINTIGACFDPQQPYYVLREKLENGSLHNYLKKNPDIPLAFRVKFALDIAYGLLFLHTRVPPVIHRDLNTHNILLSSENVAKLANFGYGIPPTISFTAPEVFHKKIYTPSSDIYSFGLLLYELVTGVVPFEGYNGAEIAIKVSKENYRPPIPSDVSASWLTVIIQCWDKDPLCRPSIGEVVDLLLEASKSEGLDQSWVVTPPQKLYDLSFLSESNVHDHDIKSARETPSISPAEQTSLLLLSDLRSMVNQEKYSDLIIEAGSEKVKFFGHKIILSTRNAQLECMIDDALNNTISLPNIPANTMPFILEFIYTSKLTTLPENIFDLMSCAHQLGLFQIVDICREYIEDNGVPLLNCGEIKLNANESTISPQNKKRLEIVRESLSNVEITIKNIEETLNSLNVKLENASVKKRKATPNNNNNK